MKKLQPVQDLPEFKRDPETSALLNVDQHGLRAYKVRKAAAASTNQNINKLQEEVTEIKAMIEKLMERMS